MCRYKAVVFDFDLTLADSSKGILICFRHTLDRFGYAIPDDRTIYNTIGLTLLQAFDVLTGTRNNPLGEEMRKEYVRKADEEMVKNTVFYDDSVYVLETLRKNGIKVGIVSTKYRYRIVDSFKMQAGVIPVDEIVGGEDVTNAKPDPQGLEKIINLFGLEKKDVLYVGDSYIDAQTARNCGVDFAGVTTGSTTYEDFRRYENVCIGKNLDDILKYVMKK